jgi:hypothetical protein
MQIEEASSAVKNSNDVSANGTIPQLVGHIYEAVQQFSIQTICGLTQLVAASPALAGSALAALLLAALLKRSRGRYLP